jgi:hypothetical protein
MKICHSGQAIVLASWEQNSQAWLEGNYFELRSKKRRLQETVGEGGTLWIVVSRPSLGGRLYTVSFRLNKCCSHTYPEPGSFGRFAVIGDPSVSRFFATADARLLLLALRFDPSRPINGPDDNQVSNSIRVPRCLSPSDIRLLDEHAARSDRWSVFISYQRSGDLELASRLSEALQRAGVSVFRDQEGLQGGDKWWPTLQRAITRSRRFIVIIGKTTHDSAYVRREVQHALDNTVHLVPVLAGGEFRNWGDLGLELASRHALSFTNGLDSVVAGLMG